MARPAEALPVARVRHLRPVVLVRATKNGALLPARERAALNFGGVVHTGPKAKADVLFSNGTQVAMKANSQIEIIAPEAGGKPLVIRVFGALSEVFVRPRGNTQVRTAAGIAAARGTQFGVRLQDETTTEVTVSEGEVEFSNPFGQVLLRADEQSVARVGAAPSPPVRVDASGLLEWSADITGLPVEFEAPLVSSDAKIAAQAEAAARRAVLDRPNDAVSHARLGMALCDLNRCEEARQAFETALRLQPEHPGALLGLSAARRGSGDAPGAAESARLALQSGDANVRADARLSLALAHLSSGQDAPAREVLNGGEGMAPPANARRLSLLGLIALRQGQPDEALQALAEAVAQDGGSSQAHALRSLALLTLGRVEAAEAAARRAVLLAPGSSQAQGTLALALFFEGQDDEAARAVSRAVAANPLSPFALLTQGRLALAQGHLDEARDALQSAVALAPDLAVAAQELGAVYLQVDNLPRAEREFRRALALNARSSPARAGLAVVLQRRGQAEAARQEFRQAMLDEPSNSSARAAFAEFLIERGELDAARQELEKSLAGGRESGIVWVRASEASLLRQNLPAAQDFAERGVQLLPDSTLARYQLGRVYLEQERVAQAEEQFRQAVILDPQNARARFALGLTRERIETGLEATRPLGNAVSGYAGAGAVGASSASQALNIQNIQAPGFEERVQAALQDPLVVRVASRSFGDGELEARGGSNDAQRFDFSYLRESLNRRSVLGLTAQRDQSDGVRQDNADYQNDRLGFSLGRKSPDGATSFFALGQYESDESGGNIGPTPPPGGDASRTNKVQPFLLLGWSRRHSDRAQTRALIAADRPHQEIEDESLPFDRTIRSLHAEVRHDAQLGRHLVSVGAMTGTRSFDSAAVISLVPELPPITDDVVRTARLSGVYLRDEYRASRRLFLVGEWKGLRLGETLNSVTVLPFEPPLRDRRDRTRSQGLPAFIASYRLDANSGLRLRLRHLMGSLRDFELLSPTDVFLFSRSDGVPLQLGGRGRTLELEYDRSFGRGAFLRASLFRQSSANDNLSGQQSRTHNKGARLRFEGRLGRATTLFFGLAFNDASDAGRLPGETAFTVGDVADLPHLAGEVGAQYLNANGYFVQPSLAYLGRRAAFSDGSTVGGFGVLNLRLGKRNGLRSTLFVEALNLSGKTFDLGGILQPGRRFRLGATNRF